MRFDQQDPRCNECRERIVNEEDHLVDCPKGDMDKHDIEEAQRIAHEEHKYDVMKDEGEL